MSDLAPFVLASVRDKIVLDLMEENEQLRNRCADVKFTGANGIPTYAGGTMLNATVEEQGEELCKNVEVFPDLHPDTLQDLYNTEVWVGERRVGTLTTDLDNQAVQLVQRGEEHFIEFRCLYWKHRDTSIEAFLEVGPFSAEEAQEQFDRCDSILNIALWQITGLEQLPGVTFKKVKFYEPNNQQPV